MLTKYQQKVLKINKKQQIKPFIWNKKLHKVYQQLDDMHYELGDQGQTFKQFLKMEKSLPNQEGTGRTKFNKIKHIQFTIISKEKGIKIPLQFLQRIEYFLVAYLQITTKKVDLGLKVVKDGILQTKRKTIAKIQQKSDQLDVFDLLDLLLKYQKKNTILIGLIQSDLQENQVEVDGRAYGDGVAIITFNQDYINSQSSNLIATIIHQTLHTVGFDHCLAWNCMMNGFSNDQFWLCPCCSRMLYHQIGIDSTQKAKIWINKLISVLEKAKYRSIIRKGKKIQSLMQ